MRLIGLKWKRREACSLWVLIGRGLDHMLCGLQKRKHSLCSILRLHLKNTTGADGDEATPVPIPNTEVKLISVENTWLATAWEDRAVPVQKQKGLNVQTFLAYCPLAQSVEHLTVNQGVASSSLAGAASEPRSFLTVVFLCQNEKQCKSADEPIICAFNLE